MDPEVAENTDELVAALRNAHARFAFLHGSRAAPAPRSGAIPRGPREEPVARASDVDVAAWWGESPPEPWEVDLPTPFDLLVLHRAPLELAGRVALHGVLILDDDPPARVKWQATTRLIFLDEENRQRQADADFFTSRLRG